MESTRFIYDGIDSESMGVKLIKLRSGMVESPFLPSVNIKEKKTIKNYKPYFQGVDRNNLSFSIIISPMEEKWTKELRREIGEWLHNTRYKEFKTYDNLNKCYYAICTNEGKINSVDDYGYLELTFQTNSPYAYTDKETIIENLTYNYTTTDIVVENKSNVFDYYYPKYEFDLRYSDNEFIIENITTGDVVIFSGLEDGEIISVDNARKIVKSDIEGVYRISEDFFNREWLKLAKGNNTLRITGRGVFSLEAQYPIIE